MNILLLRLANNFLRLARLEPADLRGRPDFQPYNPEESEAFEQAKYLDEIEAPEPMRSNWPDEPSESASKNSKLLAENASELYDKAQEIITEFMDLRAGSILEKLFELAAHKATVGDRPRDSMLTGDESQFISAPSQAMFKSLPYQNFKEKFEEFNKVISRISNNLNRFKSNSDDIPEEYVAKKVFELAEEYFTAIKYYLPWFTDIIGLINYYRTAMPLIKEREERRLIVQIFGVEWSSLLYDMEALSEDLQILTGELKGLVKEFDKLGA